MHAIQYLPGEDPSISKYCKICLWKNTINYGIMMMMTVMTVMPVKKYIHEAWPAKLSVSVQPSIVTPALFNSVNFGIGDDGDHCNALRW